MLDKLLKGEKTPYANELPAPFSTKADLDKDYYTAGGHGQREKRNLHPLPV